MLATGFRAIPVLAPPINNSALGDELRVVGSPVDISRRIYGAGRHADSKPSVHSGMEMLSAWTWLHASSGPSRSLSWEPCLQGRDPIGTKDYEQQPHVAFYPLPLPGVLHATWRTYLEPN